MSSPQPSAKSFDAHLTYIKSVVENDGPDPDQYDEHLAWYSKLNDEIECGAISEPERDTFPVGRDGKRGISAGRAQ